MQVIPVGRRAALVEVDDAGQALSLALWARCPRRRRRRGAGRGHRADRRCRRPRRTARPAHGLDAGGGCAARRARRGRRDLRRRRTWRWSRRPWGIDARARWSPGTRRREYVVAFCGFAPGFAYLHRAARAACDVPRPGHAAPRVPAGSVALAGPWTGDLSDRLARWLAAARDAPTRRCGTSRREQPALLPPGTRVRFRDAAVSLRRTRSLDPGALATVQDRGRPGLGAPRGAARRARWTRRPPRWPTGWSATTRTRRCWRRRSAGSGSGPEAALWLAVTGAPCDGPGRRPAGRLRRPGVRRRRREVAARPGPRRGAVLPGGRGRDRRAGRCSARGRPTPSAWVGPPRLAAGDGAAASGAPHGDAAATTTRRGPAAPGAAAAARRARATTGSPPDAVERAVRARRTPSPPDSNRVGLRLTGAAAGAARDGRAAERGDGARRGAGAAGRAAGGVAARTTR